MMLIEQLKKANMDALRNKDTDARAAISVVLNKFNIFAIEQKAVGKETTDADVISVLSKVIKELSDEKEGYAKVGNAARVENITRQEATLKSFMPQMMSEEDIRKEILALNDKTIPSVMKHFKTNFAGKADMGLVNKVARSLQ